MNSIKIYRVAQKCLNLKIPFLPKLAYYLIFLLYNSIIPSTAQIGKGSNLNYGGIGVVIHPHAIIGENVIIGANVTIGGNFNGSRPSIGNNVYIATGAKILGATIGNNVIIGANSVVTKDIPDNTVVAGVPGKVIRPINLTEEEFLHNINAK